YFLPATHLVYGLQTTMLGGASLTRVGMEMLSLIGGAAFCFFISTKLFRWEPEEKVDRRSKILALAAFIPFLLLGAWENVHRDRMTDARRIMDSIRSQSAPRPPQQQSPDSVPPPQQP
ncbi:MAG: hypothetical protein L0177_15790, partial [Chloroflexi bacterium]|nr:hypothetical protein [Chloroflexota bacterium]